VMSIHGVRGYSATVLVSYVGKNKNLVSGNQYSRRELAKAFDEPYHFICARLDGRDKAVDSDFSRIKHYRTFTFTGKHKSLVTNRAYSIKQLSSASGVAPETIRSRVGQSLVCTMEDLKVAGKVQKFFGEPTTLNSRWLRRKLI